MSEIGASVATDDRDYQRLAPALLTWQRQHGRHDLPWQGLGPYAVWLSEVMLQQTQVQTVIPYFQRLLSCFPTVADLADAPQDVVMALWSGLGYYSRARNLHAAAQQVMREFNGVFPSTAAQLQTLPGIGRSTAAAIAAFCYSERVAICDANVKRVLGRYYGLTADTNNLATAQDTTRLWQLAQLSLPPAAGDMPRYTQAIMDFGALCCTAKKPQCPICPVRADCAAQRIDFSQPLVAREPRPKKARLGLNLHWAFMRNTAGELYVVKRPSQGIWAGLYCVPTYGSEAALRLALGPLAGLHCFTTVRQALTHRDLTISAWQVVSDTVPAGVEGGGVWLAESALLQLGLPASLRRVLDGLGTIPTKP